MRLIGLSLRVPGNQALVIGTTEAELRGTLMQRDRENERLVVLKPVGEKLQVGLVHRSDIIEIKVSVVGVALKRTNGKPYKALAARLGGDRSLSEMPCLLLHTQRSTHICFVPPGTTAEIVRDLLRHSAAWPERCIPAIVEGQCTLLGGEDLQRRHRPQEHRWNDRVSHVAVRTIGGHGASVQTLSAVG